MPLSQKEIFTEGLDAAAALRQSMAMAKIDDGQKLSWPWWASWALVAVFVTSVVTVAATLYDIL